MRADGVSASCGNAPLLRACEWPQRAALGNKTVAVGLGLVARSIFASCIFWESLRSMGELRRRRTRETATCAATSHAERHHGQILQIVLVKLHRWQTYSCRVAGTIWRHGSESHLLG